MNFSRNLIDLRKQNNFTQEKLASKLNVSFQTISKWENEQSLPDIIQLERLADIFKISVDTLIGHIINYDKRTQYEDFYATNTYYWGTEPSHMCYQVLKLKPPIKSWRILDVGCGEGKDAVFFARNGYDVTAIDISNKGLIKGKKLASLYKVDVNFIQADINNFRLSKSYDIIFSSGVLHYLNPKLKRDIIKNYQEYTTLNGINVFNVFVYKPFIKSAPDEETPNTLWRSGELAMLYDNWYIHDFDEKIFDCNSNNIQHKHCMNTIIAEKY